MKKETKNTVCHCDNCYICTRAQKIWAWLALFAIFFCGLMTGYSLWGYKTTKPQDKQGVVVKSGRTNLVRKFIEKHKNPCIMREDALLQKVSISDNLDIWEHTQNAKIYTLLSNQACPENQEKFKNLALAEVGVVNALRFAETSGRTDEDKPCSVIESSLLEGLPSCSGTESWCHADRASIFSKIAENGCPENSEKYKQRALNELQIADGVRINDADIGDEEVRATVNTYKKLQMQNEAKRYIKKVEKLVNPGVDFIMEIQRVIEE